jgi:hypothetical protein
MSQFNFADAIASALRTGNLPAALEYIDAEHAHRTGKFPSVVNFHLVRAHSLKLGIKVAA